MAQPMNGIVDQNMREDKQVLKDEEEDVGRLAGSWMAHEGSGLHPALGFSCQLDGVKCGQPSPRDPDLAKKLADEDLQQILKECEKLKRRLDTLIERYRESADPPLDIVGPYKFENMLDLFKAAVNRKQHSERGLVNSLLTTMGEYADTVVPWFHLIPDELGTFYAGLYVLFQHARRRVQHRDKILQAFHDIPLILKQAHHRRATFKDSEELKREVWKLYKTLLHSIAELIDYLIPPHKFWDLRTLSIGKASSSEQEKTHPRPTSGDIDKILDGVRNSANSFKTSAAEIFHEIVASTCKVVDCVHGHVAKTHEHAISTSKQVGVVHGNIETLGERSKDHQNLLIDVRDQIMQIQKMLEEKMLETAVQTQTNLRKMFIDHYHDNMKLYIGQLETALANSRCASPAPPAQPLVDVSTLLSFMALDPTQYVKDLDMALKSASRFSFAAQGQAKLLLRRQEFTDWTDPARGGDILLVEGHLQEHRSSRGPSPMSSLAANLVMRNLALSGTIGAGGPSFYFFCGLQIGHDAPSGPTGLLRSLIVQLVHYLFTMNELSLGFVVTPEFRDGIEVLDFGYLLATMRELLRQLATISRRTGITPYIIVDGVNHLETEEHAARTDAVMEVLLSLACPDDFADPSQAFMPVDPAQPFPAQHNLIPARGGFKLLLTAAYSSNLVGQRVAPHRRVVLSAGRGAASPMTCTNMGWAGYQPPYAAGDGHYQHHRQLYPPGPPAAAAAPQQQAAQYYHSEQQYQQQQQPQYHAPQHQFPSSSMPTVITPPAASPQYGYADGYAYAAPEGSTHGSVYGMAPTQHIAQPQAYYASV